MSNMFRTIRRAMAAKKHKKVSEEKVVPIFFKERYWKTVIVPAAEIAKMTPTDMILDMIAQCTNIIFEQKRKSESVIEVAQPGSVMQALAAEKKRAKIPTP